MANVYHILFLFSLVGLILIKGVFPVIFIVLIASIGLAVIVAVTSSTKKPPIYHCVRS